MNNESIFVKRFLSILPAGRTWVTLDVTFVFVQSFTKKIILFSEKKKMFSSSSITLSRISRFYQVVLFIQKKNNSVRLLSTASPILSTFPTIRYRHLSPFDRIFVSRFSSSSNSSSSSSSSTSPPSSSSSYTSSQSTFIHNVVSKTPTTTRPPTLRI